MLLFQWKRWVAFAYEKKRKSAWKASRGGKLSGEKGWESIILEQLFNRLIGEKCNLLSIVNYSIARTEPTGVRLPATPPLGQDMGPFQAENQEKERCVNSDAHNDPAMCPRSGQEAIGERRRQDC